MRTCRRTSPPVGPQPQEPARLYHQRLALPGALHRLQAAQPLQCQCRRDIEPGVTHPLLELRGSEAREKANYDAITAFASSVLGLPESHRRSHRRRARPAWTALPPPSSEPPASDPWETSDEPPFRVGTSGLYDRIVSVAAGRFADLAFAAAFAEHRTVTVERVTGLVVALAEIRPGQRVVDLCCGSGLLASRRARGWWAQPGRQSGSMRRQP
jgi:hypothetical protein